MAIKLAPPLSVSSYSILDISRSHGDNEAKLAKYLKMAVVDESWQTVRPTIKKGITFLFNKEILIDVMFVVPSSTDENERKKVIPAHKFVLAISSPVFFIMFYGQMAESTDSIELPDCDYESLLEMLRHFYSDEVNLKGT